MTSHEQRTRQVLLAAVALLSLLLLLACDLPGSSAVNDLQQYISDMREPLARFSRWSSDLAQFQRDAREGDLKEVACASGRLEALIAEGTSVVAQLRAVQAPSVIASAHSGVADAGQRLVDKLLDVRTLVCERGDVAAARSALDEVDVIMDDLGEWLGKLSTWLKQR